MNDSAGELYTKVRRLWVTASPSSVFLSTILQSVSVDYIVGCLGNYISLKYDWLLLSDGLLEPGQHCRSAKGVDQFRPCP